YKPCIQRIVHYRLICSPTMRIAVFVFFNLKGMTGKLQLNGYVNVYIFVFRVVLIILHIPAAELAHVVIELTFFVYHGKYTQVVLLTYFIVICTKSRSSMHYTRTIFCSNEIAGNNAPRVTA